MTDIITGLIADMQVITDASSGASAMIIAIKDLLINAFLGVTSVIASAAVAAKYLPPPDQPGFLSWLHRVINKLAQNSGHAANANKGDS